MLGPVPDDFRCIFTPPRPLPNSDKHRSQRRQSSATDACDVRFFFARKPGVLRKFLRWTASHRRHAASCTSCSARSRKWCREGRMSAPWPVRRGVFRGMGQSDLPIERTRRVGGEHLNPSVKRQQSVRVF